MKPKVGKELTCILYAHSLIEIFSFKCRNDLGVEKGGWSCCKQENKLAEGCNDGYHPDFARETSLVASSVPVMRVAFKERKTEFDSESESETEINETR